MNRLEELESWDRNHFFHPSTHLADFARGTAQGRIIRSGQGATIEDAQGNRLLDGFAGLYCVNVGYGCAPIIEAIATQAEQLAYYHAYVGHGTEASIELSRRVLDCAPANMSKIYYGLSGSDANETNIKLIWYYNNILGRPEKKKIISRWRGYHGSGLMTGSLTGLQLFHKQFDLPFSQVLHTQAPYYYHREEQDMSEQEFSADCATKLEALIEAEGADTIAAFIGEPVLGTGGLVPPPEGYWQAIQPILEKHDILLIADEVVTGFGRLGTMFGSTYYGMNPEIISIAKGLTSAYAPLSGSIVSEKIWSVLEAGTEKLGVFGHGWTYSAHPLCAAAGVANLKQIEEKDLVRRAGEIGEYFNQALVESLSEHPHVGEVRGVGLLSAIEFVEDKKNRGLYQPLGKVGGKVAAALLQRGVIARAMPEGDILGFAPPFVLTREEADKIVSATRAAVVEVLG